MSCLVLQVTGSKRRSLLQAEQAVYDLTVIRTSSDESVGTELEALLNGTEFETVLSETLQTLPDPPALLEVGE